MRTSLRNIFSKSISLVVLLTTLTVAAIAQPTSTITPSSVTVCSGTSVTLTNTATGATSWQWYEDGVLSGPNSPSWTFTATANHTYTATATDGGGTGPLSNAVPVTVNNVPATPLLTGTTTVCAGQTIAYTVTNPDPTATSYVWSYSGTGGTISGSGSSINITYSASATSGNVTVTEVNGCGSATSGPYAIAVTQIPAQPSGFTTASSPVCADGNSHAYAVPAVAGATGYAWSYSGTNVSYSATTVSPNNTLTFGNGTATSGVLSVSATNSCGTSSAQTTSITVNPNIGTIGSISGTATVCQGQTGVSYSIPAVANATTYTWNYSGTGATITNNGNNNITISFSNAAGASGTLTVTASNSCGNVTSGGFGITVDELPTLTGPISGANTICQNAGNSVYTVSGGSGAGASYIWSYSGSGVTYTNNTGGTASNTLNFGPSATSGILSVYLSGTCGNSSVVNYSVTVNPAVPTAFSITGNTSVCQGQSGVTYSVPSNAGVTSYNWTYSGTGATINNNGNNNISINFSNTATTGVLTCTETNSCGSTANTGTFTITVNTLPTLTGPISGNATVCQNVGAQVYNIAGGGGGITSYIWNYTGSGVTYSNNTGATASNTLTFGASATSGTLSVYATNACGTTSSVTYAITVNSLPATPASFTAFTSPVCQGQNGVAYSVPNDPNVTSYTWAYTGTNFTLTPSGNSATMNFGAAATGGTLSVSATNSCGTSSNLSQAITVNSLPATPSAIAGSTTPCQNTTVTYSVTNVVGVTYNWTYSGTGASITNLGGGQANVTFSNTATSGTLSVTATNSCGTSTASTQAITVSPFPTAPTGFTAGSATACQSTGPVTYTVNAVAGATSYNWAYSGSGVTFGGGTSTAAPTNTLSFGATATSGTLSVTAQNTCGTSTAVTYSITVNPTAPAPGAISGLATVCQSQTGVSYSVPSNVNISTYTWSYSGSGATISNNGTNSITINFSATATSGTLSISASNSCGTNPTPSTLVITVNPAAVLAGPMSGLTPVCQGVTQTYTVAGAANVTTYNWSYSGTGATFSATTGTNSNSVTFSGTATSGVLSVTGTNSCGTTTAVNYPITVNSLPATPSGFTTATPSVCQGQNGVTYTVPNDPNVTSYTWTYTGGTGATIVGTGNSITVDYSATATSGTLNVTTTNACGTSTPRTLSITVTPTPTQPSTIAGTTTPCQGQTGVVYTVTNTPGVSYVWSYSGTGATITNLGNGSASVDYSATATNGTLSVYATNTCGNSTPQTLVITPTVIPTTPGGFTTSSPTVCQGNTGVVYTVPAVTGATSYIWTYSGTGATINGTTNSVTIDFSATATSGILSVSATNTCATSAARTMSVTVNTLPAQPAAFTTSNPTPCQGQNNVVYTVPNDPAVTSYTWTYSGTGLSYVGNVNGNSVTVNFSNTATAGTLSVTGTNSCGTSVARTIAITPQAFPTLTSVSGLTPVCQGAGAITYTATGTNVTTYNWSYSGTGVTYAATTATATNNFTFSNTATSGTVSVTATNTCGTTLAQTQAVTVTPLPGTPGLFTSGPSAVCQGNVNITYTTGTATDAVSYNWTYGGTGVTINTTGNNTANLDFSATATSGTLSVYGVNACGQSVVARSMPITVNSLPNQPSAFTVFTTPVCAGTNNVTYTVPNDPTVTYTWSYTVGTGATINGVGNSVSVSFSNTATSGNLNVTATNACGTSIARTLAIVVDPLPATPASFTTSDATICQGETGVSYSVPVVAGATSYTWTYSGTGATITGNGTNSITIDYSATSTSGTLSVVANNACGASVTPLSMSVNVQPPAVQPASIAGATNVCVGQTGVAYSVVNDPNATYTWSYTVGTGATINGTGNAITIDFSNTATSGTLNVFATANNGCNVTATTTLNITVTPIPAQPGAISVPGGTICQGTSGNAYSIAAVPNATTYTWSYSGTGATINNNGTTNVTIDFSATATSGTLSVTAGNTCGTSPAQTTTITVNPAVLQPGGFTTSSPVVCAGGSGNYVVPNVAGNTYTWTYGGAGATILGAPSNAVTVAFSNAATSGTISVTATNVCGTSAPRSMFVTVTPLPAAPTSFTASSATVCQGQAGVTYSVNSDPNVTSYTWTYSGTGATIAGTGNSVTISFSNTATNGTLSVVANNSCGTSTALTMGVTVTPLPAQPGTITGTVTPCAGAAGVSYSVPVDANIVTYNWSYSGSGATIVGSGNAITINFTNTATSGTLSVTGTNTCGTSTASTLGLSVVPIPSQPGAFTTSSPSVCEGATGVIYTVPTVAAATSYTWTYSGTGATFASTTNTVSIDFAIGATSGTLSVVANNACGTSTARTMAVLVTPTPATPSAIAGSNAVCGGTSGLPYSVTNVAGTTYTWTYSGTGASITGTGNAITMAFAAQATSGTLSVTATNSCGTSTASTLAITVTPIPLQPSTITGTNPVCAGTNGNVYTVTNDINATSYTWTYSGAGASITNGGNTATIDYGVAATSGTLSVTANNACGISTARTAFININPLPAQPANFTTSSTVVCQGQNGVIYTVPNDPTVTYTWVYTTGTGATINGNGNSVTVDFSATATSGTLEVTATNACSTSVARTINITVNTAPAAPVFTAVASPVCQGQNGAVYTVTNVPGVTYTWSYTGAGGNITGSGNSILVNFANNATSGDISVTATNTCGTSTASTAAVTVNPLPNQPGTITGTANPCQGASATYTVASDPTITTYNWSYSGLGATIPGNTNSENISFAANATSGTLSVTGTNACGTSIARTFAITMQLLPTQPGAITGNINPCEGQSGVIYSVPNDPSVTYTWAYSGAGATLSGIGSTIVVDYAMGATNGTLSVTATNACGTSTATNLNITINTQPANPGAITGTSPVCQGATGNYSVTNVPGTTYTWTYSGTGATVVGSGAAITINFGNNATSGNLSVTASNACGTSTASTLAITVDPLPNRPAPFIASTSGVCQGQTGVAYAVPNDPTVTYTWTYSGTGATITGTGASVSVDYSNTATSGTLSVTATNACGTSSARTISITVTPLPNPPGAITGVTPVCQGQNGVIYTSLPVDPSVTYAWTYTGTGATIGAVANNASVNFSNTATAGDITVTATNACGTSTATTFAVAVNTLPAQPSAITGTSPVCQGVAGTAYSVINDPTITSYNWNYSGSGATINGSGNAITVDFSNTATSGNLTVTATNTCGTSTASSFSILINPLPNQPAAFTTSSPIVCQNQTGVVYSVPNDPTVTYTWTFTGTGATIAPAGNSAIVDFSATATSGSLDVTATNGCGTSIARSIAVTVNPLPTTPSAITGSTTVCQGQNAVAYSVTNDPTVTYTWSYSGTGAVINGITNAITINFSATATAGTLSVTATNSCGISTASTLAITVNPLPTMPAPFTASSGVVCQGQTGVVYTVPNDPTVTYTWTYTGTGATINGTTNSVTVDFSNTATSGTINVTATNACGTSLARSLGVTVNPLPAQPGTFITSSTVVCQGQVGVIYTVPNDPLVTSYTWSYSTPGDVVIAGAGNSVALTFSNTAGPAGTLTVIANNACGVSTPQTINITVNPLPTTPGAITGVTPVCQGQTGVAYSVTNDPTVTYNWSYSGIGGSIVGSGNAITMTFSNTATSGNLSVTATNSCGTSTASVFAIQVDPLPLQPTPITGVTTVCQAQTGVVYSVVNDPTATSYTWLYTGTGATITGTGNSVTVDFSNTATSGNITVVANNSCGTSLMQQLAITVNPLPNQPAAFITSTTPVCQGQSAVIYEVPNDPTVTYTWTYTGGTGATISGTGHLISIDFSNSATSGNLNVTATNACGTSIAQTLAITVNPLPAQPAAITGTATPCQGATVVYSVPVVAGATSYTWTYSGTGATFASTTNTVSIAFNNIATSGTLSVWANNACGTSLLPSTQVLTVSPLPLQPANFTTSSATVCQGQNAVVYTVPAVAGATSYTWTYSGTGMTGITPTNSITVNFSNTATSGTLSVIAVNACGTSPARTMAITVNPLPVQPGTITGVSPVCQGQNNVNYSVVLDPTVVTYNWTYTVGTGANISGTGNIASVNFSNTATTGVINVSATNACGTSIVRTFNVTVNPLPAQPSVITGPAAVCQGATGNYSVTNVAGTTYGWNYSGTGVTITGTGNAITLNFSAIATAGTLSVTATNTCGTSIARTTNITVNPLPAVPGAFVQATNTVCQGQSAVVFEVPIDPTVTYTWTYSGTGHTITTFGGGHIANVAFSNTATSGTLSVTATNACGTSAARTIAITVNPLPNQPSVITGLTTVCQGVSGVAYSVTNDPTVTYTWSYSGNGVTVNNINGNTATLDYAINATSGTLTVIAHNACGNSTARTLNITVNPLPAQPAVWLNSTAVVCQGQTSVIYTVPFVAGVVYNWAYTGTGATLTGANNTRSIDFSTTATSGLLTVTASNACGVSSPLGISITVNPLPTQPQPFDVFTTPVCQGQENVMYGVPYDSSVTYNWSYSGTGANILGTGNLVTVNFDSTATSGTLSVTATNSCGTTPATTVDIVVNELPRITTQPHDSTLCEGGNASFNVVATGTALTYQWQVDTGTGFNNVVNNALYSGATTNKLLITAVPASMNNYKYQVIVNGTCLPAATSVTATLHVNTSPVLTSQPVNKIICEGSNTTFSVTATGTALAFQWQVNDGTGWANAPAAAPYSGTNTNTLTITAATAVMNGYQYRVVVSGTCAPSVTSTAATLSVNFTPIITTQPAATVTVCENAPATITMAAIGAGLTYQWQENAGAGFVNLTNNGFYTGVNTNSLNISAVAMSMSGYQYRVVITGACPTTVISNVSTLNINQAIQWTGIVDNLWSNPANWGCGTLPTANTVVRIDAAVPNMPIVDIPTAICDSLIIDPGASVTFSGTGNALEIKGSIINNGTFDASNGEVNLSGAATQSIPGGAYAYIRLNGNGDKMIDAAATVASGLVLNNGYLTIGGNDITIANGASITGGNAASFVVTNGTGRMIVKNVGSASVNFPVGSVSTSYTPLRMSNNGVADDFMVNVLDGVFTAYVNDQPSGSLITDNVVNKTWIVSEAVADGSNVALTLQWNPGDELTGFDRTQSFLSHYIDPNWIPGTTGPAFGPGPYVTTLAGITSFSPFGVGSAGSPLVVSNTVKADGNVTLYPNPVSGDQVFVKFTVAPKGTIHIRITDMVGKTVSENDVNMGQHPNGVVPVSVSDISAGAYLFQVVDKNNQPLETIKFNKQ